MPKVLQRKLLSYCHNNQIAEGWIFVTKNGKLKDRSNIWREMKRLKEKAGVAESKIFPHNFRHLFARIYYKVTKDITGLADLLGHSSINVRKAMEILVGEEILIRKRRMGTFVAPRRIPWNPGNIFSFSKTYEAEGRVVKTELLGAELKKAEAADLQRLELNDNMVLSIKRLRYVDGIPLTIEEMHFSREYLYLLMEDLTGSIHSLLQEHGVKLKAAQKSFAICNATKEEAELLNVERGSALLFMKNMFYDQNKKPVFFSKDVFNADYFELKFTLQDNDSI